jgi:hypothetical protein
MLKCIPFFHYFYFAEKFYYVIDESTSTAAILDRPCPCRNFNYLGIVRLIRAANVGTKNRASTLIDQSAYSKHASRAG